jgi:LacI family transcriptional regulator
MIGPDRVTLADVAALAKVSVTTASYVLNGRAEQMRISAEATERVRAAAVELSYRPNRVARNLRTATTSTIGVISDHVASGAYASRMLTGAATAARGSDRLLMIGESEGDRLVEATLIEEMLDRQVDGIVYATRTHSRVAVPASLQNHPLVLLNCVDTEGVHPAVVPDEVAGGRLAATTLIEAGLGAHIHVIGEDPAPNAIAGPLRLQGLQSRLAEAGHSLAGIVRCAWDVLPAHAAVSTWLADGARPSALVCLNDRIAMGTYQALAERGLEIPVDVSVISFDGSELATWLRPELTSVALPFAELGARAVEILIQADLATAGVTRVPMPLRAGASVGPPGRYEADGREPCST